MILGEQTLRENLRRIILEGADEEMVNESSIDLRVGSTMKWETPGGWCEVLGLRDREEHFPLAIPPGGFILVSTLEVVHMPLWATGELKMKSTRAREGWTHTTAGHVEPGWKGVLTMELKNLSQYRSLPIYPGLRMCQLVISMLDRQASVGYHGKYQGATTVEGAK